MVAKEAETSSTSITLGQWFSILDESEREKKNLKYIKRYKMPIRDQSGKKKRERAKTRKIDEHRTLEELIKIIGFPFVAKEAETSSTSITLGWWFSI